MRTISSQKGFTLIELMVCAAIIALLSSIALSSLTTEKAKARDTKKISELHNLQNALELYELSTGSYPQPKDSNGNDTVAENRADGGNRSMTLALKGLVDNGYIATIPVPPTGSAIPGDAYYYQTTNVGTSSYQCGTRTLGSGGVPYMIYFILEQPRNLTPLYQSGFPVTNGYCYTLN